MFTVNNNLVSLLLTLNIYHLIFACSKSTIETEEKAVKYVQS